MFLFWKITSLFAVQLMVFESPIQHVYINPIALIYIVYYILLHILYCGESTLGATVCQLYFSYCNTAENLYIKIATLL